MAEARLKSRRVSMEYRTAGECRREKRTEERQPKDRCLLVVFEADSVHFNQYCPQRQLEQSCSVHAHLHCVQGTAQQGKAAHREYQDPGFIKKEINRSLALQH